MHGSPWEGKIGFISRLGENEEGSKKERQGVGEIERKESIERDSWNWGHSYGDVET